MPKKKNHTSSRKSARIKAIKAKLMESYEEILHGAADFEGKHAEIEGNFADNTKSSIPLVEHSSSAFLEEEGYSTNSSIRSMACDSARNMGFNPSSPSPQTHEDYLYLSLEEKIERAKKECTNSVYLGKLLEEKYNVSKAQLVKYLSCSSMAANLSSPSSNKDFANLEMPPLENLRKSDEKGAKSQLLELERNASMAAFTSSLHEAPKSPMRNGTLLNPYIVENTFSASKSDFKLINSLGRSFKSAEYGSNLQNEVGRDKAELRSLPAGQCFAPDGLALFAENESPFAGQISPNSTAKPPLSALASPKVQHISNLKNYVVEFHPKSRDFAGSPLFPANSSNGADLAAKSPMFSSPIATSKDNFSTPILPHNAWTNNNSSSKNICSKELSQEGTNSANKNAQAQAFFDEFPSLSQVNPSQENASPHLNHGIPRLFPQPSLEQGNTSSPPPLAWNSPKDWQGTFEGNLSLSTKLNFIEPYEENGFIGAIPPEDVYLEGDDYYKHCLIGQFLDKPPPFFLLRRMVDVHWRIYGKVEIKSTENGLFVFKFENENYCEQVLEQMRHVNHRPLLLRRWDSNAQLMHFS